MSRFDSYKDKFSCLRMRREDGILEMRLHTNDGPLRWGLIPHGELPDAFAEVGRDRDNRVVILTGTGEEFSGIRANVASRSLAQGIGKACPGSTLADKAAAIATELAPATGTP